MLESGPFGRSEEEIKKAEEILKEKDSSLELEDPRERDPGQFYGKAPEKSYDDVYAPTPKQQEAADEILEGSELKNAEILEEGKE